jgi:MSHA pilin protein MshD
MCRNRRACGLTLIEVVIFMLVVAIGFTSLFMLHANTARASVDPLVRKQALALATAFLEEIELRPFTFCDPDDPQVFTAQSASVGATGCSGAGTVENTGPEAGESSAGARTSLDNVNDYSGFVTVSGANIRDITGSPISATGLNGYSVSIAVANIAAGELGPDAPAAEALKITVTVTGPAGVSVQLQGYRLRYAPNSP